jgi:hypothetical protein
MYALLISPASRSSRQTGANLSSQPIFLRVCHSPWPGLSQTLLTYIRAFIVSYLTAVGGILIDYKLNKEDDHTDWRLFFQFSTISFFLLWLYHVIAFVSRLYTACPLVLTWLVLTA